MAGDVVGAPGDDDLLRRLWEPSAYVFCDQGRSTPSEYAWGLRSMMTYYAVKMSRCSPSQVEPLSACILSCRTGLEEGEY